ncbi:hypothetical protein ACHWQZ_G003491 [Mnemiopsis leidyi]
MTDVDVKTTKKRGAVGRPKKVVKSPKKNSRPDSGDTCNVDFDYCPCKSYIDEELSVECESCNKYWHLCCVGLGGLKEDMVQLLVNWKCQDCFTCPYSYKDTKPKLNQTNDCGTIKVMVRDELHAIQPVIKATIEDAVRNVLSESVCSKEDVEHVVKSYADAARTAQKNVIEEAAVAQSSKKVVESVVRQLDADKVEREKRKFNVVVLNAPEPKKELAPEDKKKEDLKFCHSTLGIPAKDIEVCWRAGKIDESKPEYCRPLVIKLKDEDLVNEWSKDGKGHKTASGHWINKDLCAADRKANFLSREARRKRTQKKD